VRGLRIGWPELGAGLGLGRGAFRVLPACGRRPDEDRPAVGRQLRGDFLQLLHEAGFLRRVRVQVRMSGEDVVNQVCRNESFIRFSLCLGYDGCVKTSQTRTGPTFTPALDAWPDAGVYQLWIELRRPVKVGVGALGVIHFAKGMYIYTGRAARGLRARVLRHTRAQCDCTGTSTTCWRSEMPGLKG
jgi:hypothetical protein